MRRCICSRLLLLVLLAAVTLAMPVAATAQVSLSVVIAPPPLPVYTQPPCPAPGYIWTPGYWAWGPDEYYWVPGTWAAPPAVGLLWTPGYWGWSSGVYVWNAGYWGPSVGFYGGVVYGFGYDGAGFLGGYWRGDQYYYNTSVTNVSTTVVRNVYRRPVYERRERAVSYNGGPGGLSSRPTRDQIRAAHERRWGATSLQRRQERAARSDPSLRVAVNHGRPPIAATPRAGAFKARGVTAARGAPHGPTSFGRRSTNKANAPNRGKQPAHGPSSARGDSFFGPASSPQGRPGYAPRPEARHPAPAANARRNAPRTGGWQQPRVLPRKGAHPAPAHPRRAPAQKGRHHG